MRTVTASKLLVGVMVAGLAGPIAPVAIPAQERPKVQQPNRTTSVSDKDLEAFAKSYIEFHRIRVEYEPALLSANDPGEKGKIEREALAKFGKAVEKQGLTLESYARLFQAVNADEQLREKALRLIAEEQKRT